MKVVNKSGGQLSLKPAKAGIQDIVLAKGAEYSFKDEKELALYKASIKGWGAAAELSSAPAGKPAADLDAEKKAEAAAALAAKAHADAEKKAKEDADKAAAKAAKSNKADAPKED